VCFVRSQTCSPASEATGRSVLFTSKREDGLFARLCIAHLEARGRFGKPFVLPQQDPEFYGRHLDGGKAQAHDVLTLSARLDMP